MARRNPKAYIAPLPKPRTKREFAAMLYNLFGILFPARAVCPGHSAPLDVLWRIYNQDCTTAVVVAARKSGKTMGVAALQVLFALTYERLESCDVAATKQQASVCYEHSRNLLFHPKGKLGQQILQRYIVDEGTKQEIELRTGSKIFITTGSLQGVNAIHPHKLFFDEVELIRGWDVIQEALLAPITEEDKKRQVVFVSSWKFKGGILDRVINTYKQDPSALVSYWCSFEVMQRIPDCSFCHSLRRVLSDGRVVSFADFCKNPDGTCKGKLARGFMSLLDVKSNFLELEEAVFRAQWLTQEPQGSGVRVFYLYPENRLVNFVPFKRYPIFVGVDYGKTSAAVVCQVLPNGAIVVFEEHLWYNLSAKQLAVFCATQIAKRMKEKYGLPVSAFVIDPRIIYALQNEFTELGLPAIAPFSSYTGYTQEKRSRVAIVNNLLTPDPLGGLPRLFFVITQTPQLYKELSEMNYKTTAEGMPTEDLPERGYHLTDALLYVVSHIYSHGIHKEMEEIGEASGEAIVAKNLLLSWLDRSEGAGDTKSEVLAHAPAESEEEALAAIREGIRQLVSNALQQVAHNLGVRVPPQVEEELSEKAFQKVEDYARSKIKDLSPAEIIYSIPPELEKELLEMSVRELDRLQMLQNLSYNPMDITTFYTTFYDQLIRDILLGGGGTPPFPPPF